MKKQIMATILVMVMLIGVIPTATVTAAETPVAIVVNPDEEGVVWGRQVNDALEAAGLKKYGGTPFTVTLGAGVMKLESSAFSGCETMTAITIPDNVEIGYGVFRGCAGLTQITLPNGITKIEGLTFEGCTGLTSIIIPDSVTVIDSYAFDRCTNLTSVTFGSNLETIGHSSFRNTGLTSLTIPDNVIEVRSSAFYGCKNLTSVKLSENLEIIDGNVFGNCTGLTSITLPDSVTGIYNGAFGGSGLTSVTIPKNVEIINYSAFENCKNLTSFSVSPQNEKFYSDESGSLYGKSYHEYSGQLIIQLIQYPVANKADSYTIPNNVTSVSSNALTACVNLKEIKVEEGSMYYYSDERGVLYDDAAKTRIIQYPVGNTATSYTIPDSVKYISNEAFAYCKALTSVTIPDIPGEDSFINIGGLAFAHTGLTSVTIPSTARMSSAVFRGCENLTSVTVADGVPGLGYATFEDCVKLTEITIPDSATIMGENAFRGCYSLTAINVGSGNENFSSDERGVLFNKDKTRLIQYPVGNTATSYTVPASVTGILTRAFYWCKNLTEIHADPQNERYISENGVLFRRGYGSNSDKPGSLFQYPVGNTRQNYTFPDNISSFATYRFNGCSSIVSVTFTKVLKDGEVEMEEEADEEAPPAFEGCDKFTTVYVPKGCKEAYQANRNLRRFNIIETDGHVNPPLPSDPCEDCPLCTAISSGETNIKGRILGTDEPSIFDALEVLKALVGMEGAISKCGNSLNAALITEDSQNKGEPSIFDALEVLKKLVGMGNEIDN